jgi:hypothetical protein
MPAHDLVCRACLTFVPCFYRRSWPDRLVHWEDGGEFEILWSDPNFRHLPAVHPRERVVVWRNPRTGNISYPGRNDAPMPERYRRLGYERVELPNLRSVERFERESAAAGHGVRSEIAWYDKGSGRGFDDRMPDLPPQDPNVSGRFRRG